MAQIPSASDIVQMALGFQGVPYQWGGASPQGFDCSGLVQYVFGKAGINLPRTTYNQINVGANVGIQQLQPGDLVFFDTDRSKAGPDHVGIYIGQGKFIAAPRPGQGVQISSLTDPYYQSRFYGARRIPGVQGSNPYQDFQTATTSAFGSTSTPPDKETLASSYGMSYAFFQSAAPELKNLFNEAVKNTWTPDVFTAHLKNTKWWAENSDTMRQADVLKKEDPATYQAQIAAAQAVAGQEAVKAGAILNTAQLNKLATNIVQYGWNNEQVANFMGQYVGFNDKHVIGGQAGQIYNTLRTYASQMGVQVSDNQIKTYAQYVTRGLSDMTGIMNQLMGQAAGKYPVFAQQIQAGATVKDLIDPYVQVMAKELDMDPKTIDATNPLIQRALNQRDAQGKPSQAMSLTDFTNLVRSQSGWGQTTAAINQTAQTAKQVLSNMGLA
jgi:hypothetical protein